MMTGEYTSIDPSWFATETGQHHGPGYWLPSVHVEVNVEQSLAIPVNVS